jgi:hypothetical protein
VFGLGDDVGGVEARELGLVGRRLGHAPEEAALGVGLVAGDVEGPLVGGEAADDVEAGLVDGALWLLGVLEGGADLVAQGGPLVAAQVLVGLGKVVLEQVEEAVVGRVGDARVVQDEGAVRDEGVGGARALGLDGGRRGRLAEEDVEVDDGQIHGGRWGVVGACRDVAEAGGQNGAWGFESLAAKLC